jgi:tetratricopeptide (TPR) repeat protein
MRLLAAVLVVLLALPALAQQDPEAARRTIDAIEGLLKQRPGDATLYFYLARFRAVLGERDAAIAALEKVAELGDGFLPPPADGFETLWDDPAFKAVYARLEAKLPRLDFAPVAFEMVDKTMLPEGIAYDAPSRAFFIGSIPQGRIFRVGEGNAISEFAGVSAHLDYVLGLAVDAPRRVLYAVSTSALTTAGEKNRKNAVVAFDVDSRKLLQRYDVPAAQQLNDVTIARGGRVFTSDSASGAIYEIAVKGPGGPRELVPPNVLRGSNGIAASPDGTRLYVAHSTGLSVVDVSTREVKRVANETRESVAAIDGLYEYHGDLIGVQNVTTPGRVILISLSRNGESVSRVRTLLSHHHNALDEPTTGAVAGDHFYLLAATGVTHFNREGRLERMETLHSPTVLKVLLPR